MMVLQTPKRLLKGVRGVPLDGDDLRGHFDYLADVVTPEGIELRIDCWHVEEYWINLIPVLFLLCIE